MRTVRRAVEILPLIGLFVSATVTWAYDVPAHSAITARAIGSPGAIIDGHLRALGLHAGVETELLDNIELKTAVEWAQDGARLEDAPETRVRNHFHNPLASTWDQAGLRWGVSPLGDSSALWQQNRRQEQKAGAGKGSWSWPNARDRYFEALTRPTPREREAAFAKLFRSLGHVMHLVQDASLPAHTRNDAHLYKDVLGIDLGNPDGYERWVDKLDPDNLNRLLNREAVKPSDRIFKRPTGLPANSRTDHPNAPSPVKRLIDTGQYVGTNPDILVGDQIGMAEFSNGNFFSDDTVFADKPAVFGTIPFPAKTSVEIGPPEPAPRAFGQYRRYFVKVRHGQTEIAESPEVRRNYRLAVPSALYEYLPDALKDEVAGLDSKVYEDYADLLLPRAVGYSAALLDYFFRGRLDARAHVWTDDTAFYAQLWVTNPTDEPMDGVLELYGEAEDGTRRSFASQRLVLEPGAQTDPPLLFSPLPADAPPGPWLLVYRGKLGGEEDAIAARWVGTGVYLVGENKLSFGGSECLAALNLDGSVVVPEMALPLPLFLFKANAAYVPHHTGFFGCNQAGGYIVESGQMEFWSLLYRTPIDTPGKRLTVAAPDAGCGLADFGGGYRPGSQSPATVNITEFEAPSSIVTLLGYSTANPPTSRRSIGTISQGQTLVFDIAEARMLGFRLGGDPPAPALGPIFIPYDSPSATRSSAAPGTCRAILSVSID